MILIFTEFLEKQKILYTSTLSGSGSSVLSDSYRDNIEKKTISNIDLIVRSLIEGDFVNLNTSSISQIKNLVETFRNDLRQGIVSSNDSIINHFEIFFQPILVEITDILSQFISLIEPFNLTTNHFIYHSQEIINTKFQELVELAEYCNLFILEYSIVDEIGFYEKLQTSLKRIRLSHKNFPFKNLSIYEHKIKFLSYKWLKRRKYDVSILKNNLGDAYNEKYVFGDQIVDLNEKVLIGEPYYKIYRDWIDKIDFHYFDDYAKVNGELMLEKLDYRNSYDLHYLVKLYKDSEPNIQELKKLEIYYKAFPKEILSKNSREKNLLYYYNNLFSKLVEDSEFDTKEIKDKYKEITNIYRNKSNNNFFIYYKYLDLKIRESKKLLQEKKLDKIDLIFLNQLLSICKTHFVWTKASLNRLYDFDYENCVVLINNLKVYHPSSFLLALSIDENEEKIKIKEVDLQKLENDIYIAKNQQSLAELNDTLGSNEKKLTETISIFTAIISFIVGSIGAFKFIETFSQALLFIAIFGTSISVFVLLIFASTKGLNAMWKKAYFLLFYPAIFLIIYFIILPTYQEDLKRSNLTMQNEKVIHLKLDSIQNINNITQRRQNLRIDSLRNKLKIK